MQSQAREECESDSICIVVVWAAGQPFLLRAALHPGWSSPLCCFNSSARVKLVARGGACLCSVFLSISILNTHVAYVEGGLFLEQLVIFQHEEAKAETRHDAELCAFRVVLFLGRKVCLKYPSGIEKYFHCRFHKYPPAEDFRNLAAFIFREKT